MTLTAAVLVLALGADADGPTRAELVPRPAAAAQVLGFDELPPPPTISGDARVQRFLGAFAGGVVVLGATLALAPLGDASCFGTGCLTAAHFIAGTFAPLLALGGAWLGHRLAGGDGGLFTSAAALGPALLLALGLLAISNQMEQQTVLPMVPLLVASGAFLAGSAALALDVRGQQLSELGAASAWGEASGGRVALTTLIIALTGGAAAAASVALTVLTSYSVGPAGAVLALALTASLGTLGTAAAAWGVHRALGGRGSFGSALVGLGLGWLFMAAGGGLFALSQSGFTFNPVRGAAGPLFLLELGAAAALFFPTLCLEWSHTDAVQASLPRFGVTAAPLRDGAMVAAALRF